MKKIYGLIIMLALLFVGINSCGGRITGSGTGGSDSCGQKFSVTYNLYVENSKSMAGYCNIGNESALETLIDDYYNVIRSQDNANEVTLNFINTSIERVPSNIDGFIDSVKKKCTERYTKIDKILEMMMDSVRCNCVNLLFSDYVFTTDSGNLQMAANAITTLFTTQLKNKDFAIAIYKYMIDFDGKYYPGGIPCDRPLPVYVWVFGSKENVCKVTRMPLVSTNCGTYFMQKSCDIDFQLEASNARVLGKDKRTINVSKWKKDRHNDYHEIKLNANLKNVLLEEKDILAKSRYLVNSSNSSRYCISDIKNIRDYEYEYTIRTDSTNPAPGEIRISYPIKTPKWVEDSNFEDKGLPFDSTTYGVAYLIKGVAKAFMDTSKSRNDYFEIKLNLE